MKRNRKWIWFFALLALLTATGITVEIWYNLRQQLRAEQVAAARQLWQEKGPSSYEVHYTLKRQDGGEHKYFVTVREGKVTSSGAPIDPSSGNAHPFDTIDAMFDYVEKQLEADLQPGMPRVFVTAVFDREDGHILRYVRSTRQPRARLEAIVQLKPLP